MIYFGDRLGLDVDKTEPLQSVAPEQLLRIGRPDGAVIVRVRLGRELHGGAFAILWTHPDLGLAAFVGNISDPFSVWRPHRVALVHAGRVRQVPDGSILQRRRENLAARAHDDALAVRRRMDRSDEFRHIDRGGSAACKILLNRNRHLARLFRREIEMPDVASLFENDSTFAERRKLDVVILEGGVLRRFLRREIVTEQIHVPVAIREKVDLIIWRPHRDDVLSLVVRDVLDPAGLEIVNPDVVGHAAAVTLPGAELPKDPVVRHLRVVRRKREKPAARHGELLGQLGIQANRVKLAVEVVEGPHARAKGDLRLRVLPRHHHVVWPHAIRNIIATERRGERQPLRLTAIRRHHAHLGVAVVLRSEGDHLPVGREAREGVVAGRRGQSPRGSAVHAHGVEISRVAEDNLRAVGRREAEQARRFGVGRRLSEQRRGRQSDCEKKSDDWAHEWGSDILTNGRASASGIAALGARGTRRDCQISATLRIESRSISSCSPCAVRILALAR